MDPHSESFHAYMQRVRMAAVADADECSRGQNAMSPRQWVDHALADSQLCVLGERAIVAISALVWGWEEKGDENE